VTSTDEKDFKSTLDHVDDMVDDMDNGEKSALKGSEETEDDLQSSVRQVLRENDRFGEVDFERLQEEVRANEPPNEWSNERGKSEASITAKCSTYRDIPRCLLASRFAPPRS